MESRELSLLIVWGILCLSPHSLVNPTLPLPHLSIILSSLPIFQVPGVLCRAQLIIGPRSHRTDSEQVWRSANNPNLLARLQSRKETRLHRPNDAYPQRWLQIL